MKKIQLIVCCAFLGPAVSSIGQDLLPSKASTPTSPSPAGQAVSVSPTPTPTPASVPALIPEPLPSPSGAPAPPPAAPTMPDFSQLDQLFKQTALGKEAVEYRAHVEWRELKNRTVNDPAVVAAKASAEAATTDLEKRNRLRSYYEIFYARMRALASTPQMAKYLDSMKKAHLNLLAQPRARPTSKSSLKAEPKSEDLLPNE